MSEAGEFIATCRRRGVEIRTIGEEVWLRGAQHEVDRLIPKLVECVDRVHELMTGFLWSVPPRRRAERH